MLRTKVHVGLKTKSDHWHYESMRLSGAVASDALQFTVISTDAGI
jgi:hypothetical protein